MQLSAHPIAALRRDSLFAFGAGVLVLAALTIRAMFLAGPVTPADVLVLWSTKLLLAASALPVVGFVLFYRWIFFPGMSVLEKAPTRMLISSMTVGALLSVAIGSLAAGLAAREQLSWAPAVYVLVSVFAGAWLMSIQGLALLRRR